MVCVNVCLVFFVVCVDFVVCVGVGETVRQLTKQHFNKKTNKKRPTQPKSLHNPTKTQNHNHPLHIIHQKRQSQLPRHLNTTPKQKIRPIIPKLQTTKRMARDVVRHNNRPKKELRPPTTSQGQHLTSRQKSTGTTAWCTKQKKTQKTVNKCKSARPAQHGQS